MSGTTARIISKLLRTHPKHLGPLTVVVGADLEGLVSAHDQTGLLVLLVLQQPHVTSTALLPLLALTVKLEQLGTHLKGLLLELLVGLGLDLLSQTDHGLEVNLGGFGGIVLVLLKGDISKLQRNFQ